MPLTIQSDNEHKVKITLTPTTPAGRPASIQSGSLAIEIVQGDATFAIVDDNSFYAISQDPAPLPETLDTVYAVSADADLGEGVVTITDVVTYHVTGAMASSLGLTASAPEPK